MPMPHTHTARQADPGQYERFRMKELADGVVAVIGFKRDGGSEIQSVRLDAEKFTAEEARKWLKDHDFSTEQFEEATGGKKEMPQHEQASAAARHHDDEENEDDEEEEDAEAGTHHMEDDEMEEEDEEEDEDMDAEMMRDVAECPMGEECPMKKKDMGAALIPCLQGYSEDQARDERGRFGSGGGGGSEVGPRAERAAHESFKRDMREIKDRRQTEGKAIREARRKEDTARQEQRRTERREINRQRAEQDRDGKGEGRQAQRDKEDEAREAAQEKADRDLQQQRDREDDERDSRYEKAEQDTEKQFDEKMDRLEKESSQKLTETKRGEEEARQQVERDKQAEREASREQITKRSDQDRQARKTLRKAGFAAPELEIAAAYADGIHICASETLELLAESIGAQGVKLRAFSMVAYTGSAMRLPGFSLPVVVDLQGMKVPSQRRPILRQHDPERIVGHSESIEITAQRLKVAGVISGVHPAAVEVIALAANNFPWSASIGAGVEKMEQLEKGQRATVNGRVVEGPAYIARQTVLGEVSFVSMGADPFASASVSGN